MGDKESWSPLHGDALFDAAPDGILIVDQRGVIRAANPQALRIFAYSEDELVGLPVEVLVPDQARETHQAQRAAYGQSPRVRPMGIGLSLRGRRKDGHELPVEISLSPLETAEGTNVICIVRDVSEQMRYREFGRAALRATEEERRRIALELHDDMAQRLATLLLRLRLISGTEDERQREAFLAELREDILEAAVTLNRIARGLRPPALEGVGIEAALRGHVRTRLSETDLDVDVEIDPVSELLGEDEKLVLYRVVQEALSNVVRHAQASRVTLRVFEEEGRLVGEVTDDGRGFVFEDVESGTRGLGLLGMRERAGSVDGRVSVSSELGEGTRIRLELPVNVPEAVDV